MDKRIEILYQAIFDLHCGELGNIREEIKEAEGRMEREQKWIDDLKKRKTITKKIIDDFEAAMELGGDG